MRKASVFCLVAIYLAIGEELRPHLKELNGSKVSVQTPTCIKETKQKLYNLGVDFMNGCKYARIHYYNDYFR